MLYIYHGQDEFSRSEAIAQLRREMDPVVGDLNTALLDGRDLAPGALQAACDTVPFMGNTRLIVVRDLVPPPRPRDKGPQKEPRPAKTAADDARLRALEGYLPQLPASTRLVLEETGDLPPTHALLKLAAACGGQVKAFPAMRGHDLARWIARRAEGKGVGIEPEAVELLATYVGPNLRLLDQELEKLAAYLNWSGAISREDVQRLVSSLEEPSIFQLVDALGSRNGRRALVLLHRLLYERKDPLYLLAMIVRQYRLLLQAQELEAQGVSPDEMRHQMEVKPEMTGKYLGQARNYKPAELKAILGQLLEIDVGIKTGQVSGPVALDLFVARWAGR